MYVFYVSWQKKPIQRIACLLACVSKLSKHVQVKKKK
jgi:hypothetical protein